MSQYLNMTAEQLSKGNQQKIQLISAFVNNPELLFLDEPFAGLDPINIEIIKEAIHTLLKQGTYIILSTHQMSVVEEYCKNILLIDKGNCLLEGSLLDIKKEYGYSNILIKSHDNIINLLPKDIEIVNKTVDTIEIKNTVNSQSLLEKLVKDKVNIEKFEIKEPSLQEIFIKKVGENK